MSEIMGVQSVVRTFALLEFLCKHGELGITQLSKLSGLSKATVFRLLNTLVVLGYVKKNNITESYGVTLKFLTISSAQRAMYDQRIDMRPMLEELSSECGETVHLVERNGKDIVYIDKIENSTNAFRMASQIGLSLPMVYTASGKVIMSDLSLDEIKQIWDESNVFAKTDKTITDFNVFIREIEEVRKNGYAIDNEENEIGVCCIAVGVRDMNGELKYAISVSVPTVRLNDEKAEKIKKLLTKYSG